MTITYPRAFPTFGVGSHRLWLSRNDIMSRDGTGRAGGVALGTSLWRAEMTWPSITDLQTQQIRAFVNSLKGASQSFLMTDPARWYPAAYRASGLPGGFDGVAGGWTLDGTRSVVTLGGLPVGFQLTEGDLVGVKDGAGAKCHVMECLEGATANGSGALAVTVNPALWAVIDGWSSAVAYLVKPAVTMRLIPGETDLAEIDALGQATTRISAIQYLAA